MQQIMPQYKIGFIGPKDKDFRLSREVAPNPNLRTERLLPPFIVYIYTGLQLRDYTPEGVEEGIGRYWNCVNELMEHKPDRIGWGGFPISSQLGRSRCLGLIDETRRRTGLPAGSDAEAVIAAMKHMGINRVAVASRWADQLNERVVQYLNHAGIEVLTITTVGQWAAQAFAMSLDMGIKLVLQLSRQAMRNAPAAQGLFIPGGTWRSLGCIPTLEEDFGIPVITNNIASTWELIHEGIAPPIKGWGRLLETP